MRYILNSLTSLLASVERIWSSGLEFSLSSAASLAIRLYVGWVFFKAGLTKIADWESTLELFEYEYAVPLLPTNIAAFLGTAGELLLPPLLALGLFSRFSAAGLFVVNAVATISIYEDIEGTYGLGLHYMWGLMLAYVMIHGGKLISVDHILKGKLRIR